MVKISNTLGDAVRNTTDHCNFMIEEGKRNSSLPLKNAWIERFI
jgi:hypothetical protein